jgi:CHAT domain-containing protein
MRTRVAQANGYQVQPLYADGSNGGIADLSGVALSDLPQTRGEVEEIGRIVGPDAVILLAKDATETAFKKEPLDQFRVLHLAVHGSPTHNIQSDPRLSSGSTHSLATMGCRYERSSDYT